MYISVEVVYKKKEINFVLDGLNYFFGKKIIERGVILNNI